MGRPRIMLDVGFFQNKKVAALAWRRQLGFIYILTEAKQQDREGTFPSKAVLKITAGVFRDGVDDWLAGGLLHDSMALCDRCVVAFPALDEGAVVVHDWSQYQVSRTTSWRLDKALDEASPETSVEQPGNIGETVVKPPSHARVSRGSSVPSSSPSTEGGAGGNLDADETTTFVYLARHGAAIRPESGFGRRLLALMDRRTPAKVLATAEAMGGPFSDRQWVFGLESALEEVPDAKAAQRADDDAKQAERRTQGIWKRRIDAYRAGGQWDPAWGEPPAAA